MKKFIWGISWRLGLAAVFLMAYAQFGKSVFMGHEYTRWVEVMKLVNSTNDGLKNVIIGDSRSEMAFMAHEMSNTTNLSLGGTTPAEGYYLLRGLEAVDTVYLSYSPFHLFGQDGFHSRAGLYDLINRNFLDSVAELAHFTGSAFDSCRWSHYNMVSKLPTPSPLHNLLLCLPSMGNIENYKFHFLDKEHFLADLRKHGLSRIVNVTNCLKFGSTNEVDDVFRYTSDFQMDPVTKHFLKKILLLSKEKGITLIWVDAPRNEDKDDVSDVSDAYWQDYERKMATFMNVPYFKMLRLNTCLFLDQNHLNETGARYFTSKLNAAIKQNQEKETFSIFLN